MTIPITLHRYFGYVKATRPDSLKLAALSYGPDNLRLRVATGCGVQVVC